MTPKEPICKRCLHPLHQSKRGKSKPRVKSVSATARNEPAESSTTPSRITRRVSIVDAQHATESLSQDEEDHDSSPSHDEPPSADDRDDGDNDPDFNPNNKE